MSARAAPQLFVRALPASPRAAWVASAALVTAASIALLCDGEGRAAFAVLAGCALLVAWSQLGGLRVARGLIWAWLLADGAGDWSFTHVVLGHLGPLPLLPTELMLALATLLLVGQGRLTVPRRLAWPLAGLGACMVAGALAGLHQGYPMLTVVRESALIYYMWAAVLAYSAFDDLGSLAWPAALFGLAVAVAAVDARIHPGVHSPEATGGFAFTMGFLLIAVARADRRKALRAALGAVLFFGLTLLFNLRGLWVGSAAGALFVVDWGPALARVRLRPQTLLLGLGVATLAACSVWLVPSQWGRITGQIASLLGAGGPTNQIANNHWRLTIWHEALRQVAQAPLGFRVGAPFEPTGLLLSHGFTGVQATGLALANSVIELSNSHLQMLLWYGAIGAFFYLWLWGTILRRLRLAEASAAPTLRPYFTLGVAALVAWLVLAAVEVILEGPYAGVFVWLLVGCLLRQADAVLAPRRHPGRPLSGRTLAPRSALDRDRDGPPAARPRQEACPGGDGPWQHPLHTPSQPTAPP